MKREIVVPEGMIGAAEEENRIHRHIILPIMQTALGWLADHPIMPAKWQLERMKDAANNSGYHGNTITLASIAAAVVKWQSIAFKPEPNHVVESVIRSMRGYSFTDEEADEIIRQVRASTKAR